jgi:hypothetical protein
VVPLPRITPVSGTSPPSTRPMTGGAVPSAATPVITITIDQYRLAA